MSVWGTSFSMKTKTESLRERVKNFILEQPAETCFFLKVELRRNEVPISGEWHTRPKSLSGLTEIEFNDE